MDDLNNFKFSPYLQSTHLCVCDVCVCVCVCVNLYGPTSGDNFVILTT